MTVFDTLKFVAFNPLQNNNPISVRRRKLMAKLDEKIQLAANKDYKPTQHKWLKEEGYTHCFFIADGAIMHILNSLRKGRLDQSV
jgi:hypothetical protein